MTKQVLPCLTGARFVAAFLVVLFHFGWLHPLPALIFEYGRVAVSFFFILSGVVLTHVYRDSVLAGKIGWSAFFNLRLSRIMPLHAATWIIATVLHVYFAWCPYKVNYPFVSWIMGLFCIQVWYPTLDNLYKWNPQAWSISCELFFYAVFPFVLAPLARRLKSTASIIGCMFTVYLLQVALCFLVSCILARFVTPTHAFLGYTSAGIAISQILLVFPPLRLGEFLVGMCIGLLILHREPVIKTRFVANLLLAICVSALVFYMRLSWAKTGIDTRTYLLSVPPLAMMLVALVSGRTFLTGLLENPILITLGEASYSLYLVHLFFLPANNSSHLKYIFAVICAVATSVIFYFFLEKPARNLWRQIVVDGKRATRQYETKSYSVE